MAKKPHKPKPSALDQLLNAGPDAFGAPTTKKSSGTTDYLGNVPHARRPMTGPFGVSEFPVTQPGYKKGDEFRLLPSGDDLVTLQQALIQAGYLNAKNTYLGSPDQATVDAFSKLLATANLSGSDWKSALASRLASNGSAADQGGGGGGGGASLPPLTINLTNPDDIKATVQKTAQTLLGQNLSDADLQNFVTAYQGMERNYQTQQYNQQYNTAEGGYGPGGEAVAPPSQEGLANQAATWLKATQPQQYQATQFGSMVTDALKSLASNGNLS